MFSFRAILFSVFGLAAVSLIAYAKYSNEKADRYRKESETYQQMVERAAEQLAESTEQMELLKAEALRVMAILESRDHTQKEIQIRYLADSREMEKLRRDDAEIKSWADQPIPSDVLRLLKWQAPGGQGSGSAATPAAE
jgi:LysB family phage lysis regulatory protein